MLLSQSGLHMLLMHKHHGGAVGFWEFSLRKQIGPSSGTQRNKDDTSYPALSAQEVTGAIWD